MSDAKKVYDFDINQYERPNRNWLCGRSAEGTPCPLGPSLGGRCRADCQPYKDGDRFYCGNATMLEGKCDQGPREDGVCGQFPAQCQPTEKAGQWECNRGKCEPGPLPDGRCSQHFSACRPVRSVLAKRRVFALFCFASAIGAALIMVAGPVRTEVIAPGPLTSQHRSTEKGCAACHVVGQGNLKDWICAAVDASETGIAQSRLCLECHGELNPHALNPHSMNPAILAKISERIAGGTATPDLPLRLAAARALFGQPDPENNQFACATCHQEHHGRDFDLKHMSDQQCQSCHAAIFEGFDDGHPEFSDYPYARRTRIYFDHQSHYDRHFHDFERTMPFGKKPDSCLSCHQLDSAGEKMIVRGFDKACASCHAGQIEEDPNPGLVLAALPTLDVQTLADNGARIGQWPNKHTSDVTSASGRLPAIMDFLLSADERYVRSRATVEEQLPWALKGGEDEQIKATQDYAWAIKELWHDLVNPDPQPLRMRLQKILGPRSSAEKITELAGTLATNKFANAARKWLPNLDAEIEAVRSGQFPQTSKIENLTDSPDTKRLAGHFRDISGLSVRYRVAGHADRFLRQWLEVSANSFSNSASGERLFAALSDPTTTGRCTKCHTVDLQGNRAEMNWLSARPSVSRRKFTKFSHSPHLKVLGDEACRQCHNLKQDATAPVAEYRSEYFAEDWSLRTNPHQFSSNFESLPKSECTTCHNRTAVQDNCLSCHNYHVH